jgi:hypothetical protein
MVRGVTALAALLGLIAAPVILDEVGWDSYFQDDS